MGCFICIGILFLHEYPKIEKLNFQIRYPTLILSSLLIGFTMIFQFLAWQNITKVLKIDISISTSMRSWYLSQFGKYIPGKVFMFVNRLNDYSHVSKTNLGIAFYLELLLALLNAGMISLSYFYFFEILDGHYTMYYLGGWVLLGLFLSHPSNINFFLKHLLSLFKKDFSPLLCSWFDLLKTISFYTLSWCALGVAFFLFISSFHAISIQHLLPLTGAFSLSVCLGMVALFAPAGLGVREGFLLLFLKPILGIEVAIIVSITSRLWLSLSECLAILLTLGLRHFIIRYK